MFDPFFLSCDMGSVGVLLFYVSVEIIYASVKVADFHCLSSFVLPLFIIIILLCIFVIYASSFYIVTICYGTVWYIYRNIY